MENLNVMNHSTNLAAKRSILAPEFKVGCPVAVVLDKTNHKATVLDLELGVVGMNVSPNDQSRARCDFSLDEYTTGFVAPCAIALGLDNHTVFIADSSAGAIFKVNTETGGQVMVSGDGAGAGPQFCTPEALVIDAEGARAIVVDSGLQVVFSVCIDSGNRDIISGSGIGSGPSFERPRSITLDAKADMAYIADSSEVAIFSVNLTSGKRELVSCNGFFGGTGEGPSLVSPTSVSFDYEQQKLFVLDAGAESLFSIDPTTGDRFIVSGGGLGRGPELLYPRSIAVDSFSAYALVVDSLQGGVVRIDLHTGDRSIVS